MELLGDVGLDRVHAQGRRRDARKRQRVLGDHHLRLAEDGVAERNVDAERASVDLAREAALGTESNAVVLHPVVLNLGVPGVRLDGEDHEVAQVALRGCIEPGEDVVRQAHHAEVDVRRGSCPLDPKLDGEATLECHGVAELEGDAGEEAVEHHELAATSEVEL